jgi:hypothetical protein
MERKAGKADKRRGGGEEGRQKTRQRVKRAEVAAKPVMKQM